MHFPRLELIHPKTIIALCDYHGKARTCGDGKYFRRHLFALFSYPERLFWRTTTNPNKRRSRKLHTRQVIWKLLLQQVQIVHPVVAVVVVVVAIVDVCLAICVPSALQRWLNSLKGKGLPLHPDCGSSLLLMGALLFAWQDKFVFRDVEMIEQNKCHWVTIHRRWCFIVESRLMIQIQNDFV